MAKFCTNCGNQLEENAAMCLNCGYMVGGVSNPASNNSNNLNNSGNVKKKGLPTWAIVLIVVGCVLLVPLIIFIAFIVFTFRTTSNIIDDVKDHIDNIDESEVITGTIDDTLENDDIRITLNDALMYSYVGDEYYIDTPAEGKEYLIFFFEVENLDDENVYISSYDFDGYVDDYYVSSKSLINDIDGVKQLSSNLAPGMKVNGYVAFEIDTTWKNFEIHYEEFDFDYDDDDDNFIFKVKNSDEESTGV